MQPRQKVAGLLDLPDNQCIPPLKVELLVYCERLGLGFWAEPVNFASNVGFLIAGLWVLGLAKRRRFELSHWDIWLLGLLILAVGVGSAVWHSLHTDWAHDLDVFPILVFIHLYLYSFLHSHVGLKVVTSAGITLLFFIASKGFAVLTDPELLNGSVFYLPAVAVLAILTGWSSIRKAPGAGTMIVAFIIFIVSLSFRTLDIKLCAVNPTGTHFLWHLLNALVLGLLVGILIRGRIAATETASTYRSGHAGIDRDQRL